MPLAAVALVSAGLCSCTTVKYKGDCVKVLYWFLVVSQTVLANS